jgi:hypothetical protein
MVVAQNPPNALPHEVRIVGIGPFRSRRLIAMPRHRLDLTITDRESVAERVKRFLAGIEQPLVSIELTGQNRAWSFYGFYQVGRSDRDDLAAKVVERIVSDPFGRVTIVARSRR